MNTDTQTQTQFNSWLWPDQTLGKRASGALREEHNALVNAHAQAQAHADKLAEALRALTRKMENTGTDKSHTFADHYRNGQSALAAYESEGQ